MTAPVHSTLSTPAALAAAGLALLCACGKTKGGAAAVASGMILQQTSDFSQSLTLTGEDEILTLGRLQQSKVAASTKQGVAYNVDLDSGDIQTIQRYFSFDDDKSTVFTVSANFVWVIDHQKTMVGRNPTPPDASHSIQISKVAVDDIVKDTTALSPIAATEYQLFLLEDNNVVVFTWASDGIKRQRVPLPTPLAKGEYTMGAGAIDELSKNYGFWMATNKRLLFYYNGWTSQPFSVKADDDSLSLVSLAFANKSPTQSGVAIGLFGTNQLSTLGKATSQSSKKSGGSN